MRVSQPRKGARRGTTKVSVPIPALESRTHSPALYTPEASAQGVSWAVY